MSLPACKDTLQIPVRPAGRVCQAQIRPSGVIGGHTECRAESYLAAPSREGEQPQLSRFVMFIISSARA